MNRMIVVIMYGLWAATVLAALASTFMDFRYLDLNVLTLVLLTFALLNSFFYMAQRRPRS